MRLRYAGVDLLLEDPDDRVNEHLRRYLNTENMRHWAENPMWRADDRQAARFSSGRFVGLPTPNYTDPPPVEINTLFWPSGAARWARCLCLVNDEQWDAIRLKVYVRNQNQAQTLEFWDEENGVTTTYSSPPVQTDPNGLPYVPSIKTSMFALPPRPVTVRGWSGAGTGERLYLLPLVDARYWWQFRSVDAFAPTTWDEAFEAIEGAIGVDITKSAIPYVYGRPSAVEFRRDYENAAMLLDAVASCVGHRIIRRWDGTVVSQSAADAKTDLVTNLALISIRTAGGERADWQPAALIPETFRTTFKKAGEWEVGEVATKTATQVWDDLQVSKTEFGATATQTLDAIKTWHCTAEVTTAGPTTTPGVTTTLAPGTPTARPAESWANELTRQLAIDWIDWQGREFDITLPGLVPWVPTGYDDWIQWTLGRIERFENIAMLTAATRVQSVPPNVGTEELPIDQPPGTTTTTTTTTTSTTSGPTTTPGPTTTLTPTTTAAPCPCLDVSIPDILYRQTSGGPYTTNASRSERLSPGGVSCCQYNNGTSPWVNQYNVRIGLDFSIADLVIRFNTGAPSYAVYVVGYNKSSPVGSPCDMSGAYTLVYANPSGYMIPPASVNATAVSCGSPLPIITTTLAPVTTSPPTTTAAPCSGTCNWLSGYDSGSGTLSWGVTGTDCTGPCVCTYPTDCPTAAGQTMTTDCGSANSPPADCTTTAAPTTTATPCSGNCQWLGNVDFSTGVGTWSVLSNNCIGSGCGCQYPASCPTFHGDVAITSCGEGATSPPVCTTAAPTTTATPTTTTAAPTTTATPTTTTTAAPCAGGTGTLRWAAMPDGLGGYGWIYDGSPDGATCDPGPLTPPGDASMFTYAYYDCATCMWSYA